MEIIVAKDAGFCKGVEKAIDIALSVEGGCVTLGNLIHNETVLASLKEKNVVPISSLDEYKDGVLLIRTHGVGKDVYDKLEKQGIKYIDATCPFVKKIHEIVYKNYNEGLKIIIIGDKDHPETIGTNGWCNYEGIIISSESDIDKLSQEYSYCVVCQTTFDSNIYKNIINTLKNKFNLVVNNNTICYTTTRRQEEALTLSKKCDIVLVIGSKTSSNTTKLFNICSKNTKTYMIETLADLKSVEIKNNNLVVGVVAGASTPKELIMEVKKHMSNEAQNNQNNAAVESGKVSMSFEEAYKKSKQINFKIGQTLSVKVVSADKDGIVVSIGAKKDGFIPASEAEADGVDFIPENYGVGQELKVKYVNNESDKYIFSKKALDQRAIDDAKTLELFNQPSFKMKVEEIANKKYTKEETLEDGSKKTVDVTKPVGIKGKVGPYEVFVPAKEIRKMGYPNIKELEAMIGKEVEVRAFKNEEGAVELSRKGRIPSITASMRVIALEKEAAKKAEKEAKFAKVIEVGQTVTGKVVGYKTKQDSDVAFGAVVRVDGFDGLAHISELSYNRHAKVEDIVKIGEKYEFLIREVKPEKFQFSLGYKELHGMPYENAAEKYPIGSTITGPIKTVVKYGVYVEIADGVDGLVPASELSRSYVKDVAEAFKVGQEVTAQVIDIDVEKCKFTLSIKALLPEEEGEESTKSTRSSKKSDSKSKKGENEEPQSWSTKVDDSASIGSILKGLGLDKE